METEKMTKTLINEFSALSEENKKKVVEMTRFLVLTQKTIVPEILKPVALPRE